jgi:hypothetical protein
MILTSQRLTEIVSLFISAFPQISEAFPRQCIEKYKNGVPPSARLLFLTVDGENIHHNIDSSSFQLD